MTDVDATLLIAVDPLASELVVCGATNDSLDAEALTFLLVEFFPGLLAAAVRGAKELVARLEDVLSVRLLVDDLGSRNGQEVEVVPDAVDEVQDFFAVEHAANGELLGTLLGFLLLDDRAAWLLLGLLDGTVLRADVVVLVALLDGQRALCRAVAAVMEHDLALFTDERLGLELLVEVLQNVGVDDAAHVKVLAQLAVALVPLLANARAEPTPERVEVLVEDLGLVASLVAALHRLAPANLVIHQTLRSLTVTVVVKVVPGAGTLTLDEQLVEVWTHGVL